MKKLLVVAMLFMMFAVITPAYAGDTDGLWYHPESEGGFFAMTRANGGYILFTVMDLYEMKMEAWMPFFGPFNGTSGDLSLILTSEANGNIAQSMTATFNLTSPTTATITITSCTSFPQQNNCPDSSPVFDLVKIF